MSTFIYRGDAIPSRDQAAAFERYERRYQRTERGDGMPWMPGLWFPIMAREEGLPRYRAGDLMSTLDLWMGRFMMANQAQWERRHAG